MSAVERFELRVAALFARHRGDVEKADRLDAEADALDEAAPLHPLLAAAVELGVVELADSLADLPGSDLA